MSDLNAIAGGISGTVDEQKAACIRELVPVVDSLRSRGAATGAIVAALAEVSMRILDDAPKADKLAFITGKA